MRTGIAFRIGDEKIFPIKSLVIKIYKLVTDFFPLKIVRTFRLVLSEKQYKI